MSRGENIVLLFFFFSFCLFDGALLAFTLRKVWPCCCRSFRVMIRDYLSSASSFRISGKAVSLIAIESADGLGDWNLALDG